MTRSDLVKAIGVQPSTITSIIQDLQREGIVNEVGLVSSNSVGRRPILLKLNRDYGQIWGVNIQFGHVRVGAMTFDGCVVKSAKQSFPQNSSPEAVLALVKELLLDLPKPPQLLGIGVACVGHVQSHKNLLVYAPRLEWRNVNWDQPLAQAFGTNVFVSNDVNALTIAERWFGAARHFRTFVCVSIGDGIGAGIYLNNQLFEGVAGGAGEIGHMCIQIDGPLCRCGEYGCLEALMSDSFLTLEARQLKLPQDPEALVSIAMQGNQKAQRIFNRMGRHLGIGLKNLVNLINPEAVILVGDHLSAYPLFQAPMEEELLKHGFSNLSDNLRLLPGELGEAGWIMGPCTLPLHAQFSPALLTRNFS